MQLENANSDLKKMNQIKSDFFSNVSHEFRTPLTLILNPLDSLYKSKVSDKQKELIRTMKKNAERVLDQVNNILKLSKSKDTDFILTYRLIDISDLIQFVVSMLSSMADVKNIIVSKSLESILVAVDEERIKDVIVNLLSNAINYSPENSKISIKLSKSDERKEIDIIIEDHGYGIPEEDLPHIFDRFYSIKKSEKSKHKGLGLGLYIVKTIIDKHDGCIEVKSKVNEGTQFKLSLPIKTEIFEKAAINFSLKKTQSIKGEEENVILPVQNRTAKYRVLLVEDVKDLNKYIASELSENYLIITASNGRTALKKIEKNLPDLIISDIIMPEMDGFEFCKALKENPLTNDIPIIFLTGLQDESDRLKAYGLGADNFLQKPFNLNELEVVIKKLIEKRNHLKEKYKKFFSLGLDDGEFKSIEESLLKKFLEHVESQISNPDLNMEFIASEIGVSRTQLYTKIESLTGETPKAVIRNLRLIRAEKMLKSNSGSISEIAYKVGFKNSSYFASIFQKKYGYLPSDIKKQ